MTKRQFDKLKGKSKPVKFCTIDGVAWYVDGYGNFFERDNYSVSKKAVDEWKQFHDNPDAVCGQIWYGIHGKYTLAWYNNMDEFIADFNVKADATPTCAATPRYEVKKVGYTKKHPYDRENYIRLPFYPVSKSERNEVKIYNSWKECCKGINYYTRDFYGEQHFTKMLKKYWEWVDKNEL